jgi:hypothetical protein
MIRINSARSCFIARSTNSTGSSHITARAVVISSLRPTFAIASNLLSSSRPRRHIIRCPLADLGSNPTRNLGNNLTDLVTRPRVSGLQFDADRFGCLGKQRQEEMWRNLGPGTDTGGQPIVALRPPNQPRKADIGEPGAAVFRGAQHDLPISALHQHVGDRLAQRAAARDREQMLLAFFLRRLDQGCLVEPLGLLEHRTRDIDLIVKRQRPHDPRRRISDRCETDREQCPGGDFDLRRETGQDVVEQRNLLVGTLRGAHDKEIGNVPDDLATPRGRATRHGLLDFAQQPLSIGHR